MAARKLAAEIEKVQKKITEGVIEFETIYDKLQGASTPAQSSKYESELKSSIKRLQRSREQVKTWLQSNDIKDKSALTESRKIIETQMEKFKASEKELKTKAFSKEGLAATRLTPAEKAKLELSQWLSSQVDELGRQVETTEAEIEQLAGGGKKKKTGGANERAAQLDHLNDRRNWHISRLEILLRLLENGALDTERVESIKEDISYFVESNSDEDFEEDEGIYDEFNLDQEEEAFGLKDNDDMISHDTMSIPDDTPAAAPQALSTLPTTTKAATKDTPTKTRRESEDLKPAEDKTRKVSGTAIPAATAAAVSTTAARKSSGAGEATTPAKDAKAIPAANFTQAKAAAAAAAAASAPASASPVKTTTASLPPIRYAAAAAAAVSPTNPTASPVAAPPGMASRQATEPAAPEPTASTVSHEASNGHAASSTEAAAEAPSAPTAATQAIKTNGAAAASPPGLASSASAQATRDGEVKGLSSAPVASSPVANIVQPAGVGAPGQSAATNNAKVPSSLVDLVSSFESAKQNTVRRDADQGQVHKSLEASLMNVPEPQDSDKPRYYVPQNPYPTPQWYPQQPSMLFDNPSIYEKFDEDTLFYIFYYSHRDYHRYLAARELKRQSWRFSTRYGTWFRRHSEPITINEEFEEGSYVYFDFESSWCQRRKNHFRFEYKYLESELV